VEAVVIAHKFLRADGRGQFTAFAWPAPDGDAPGAWVAAEIDPCRSGIHACRPQDLPYWTGPALYEVELEEPVVEHRTKVVAARGRLVRRLRAWEERDCEAYTRWCAERARAIAREAGLEPWTAAIEPNLPTGAGTLGFIAARIAEQAGGAAAFAAERERQAAWLAERLGLDGAGDARPRRHWWQRRRPAQGS
jgi:hypothetical protein